MDLATIVVPEQEAKAKLAEYAGIIYEEGTVEDEALAAGYRAARRGLPLIRLSEAIRRGGYFDNGLPRIAVINADARECSAAWDGDDMLFGDEQVTTWRANRGALVNRHTVRVPGVRPVDNRRYASGWTIVPIIPPHIRPRRNRLHCGHILWEVEEWKRGISPRDPALLRHIRGDLWAVLACWDLTELERAVLAG